MFKAKPNYSKWSRIRRRTLAVGILADALRGAKGGGGTAVAAGGLFAGVSLTKAQADTLAALLAGEVDFGVHGTTSAEGVLEELLGRIKEGFVHNRAKGSKGTRGGKRV